MAEVQDCLTEVEIACPVAWQSHYTLEQLQNAAAEIAGDQAEITQYGPPNQPIISSWSPSLRVS